jgi:glycosyltransferase involved in cell wall biosynthesis
MNQEKVVSIIIPMKNESEGVNILFKRLIPILKQLSIDFEIVVVNDGSTDDTVELLLQQKAVISQIKIIDLARNFGKEAALYAGFFHCNGDCAVSIDADLQDPPELILDMVNYWINGFEVVTAVREMRNTDTYLKRKTAGIFYKIMNKISTTELIPNAGDYRLLDRVAVNAFLALGERVRFNKGLFAWIGFKQKLVYHKRENRSMGKTKWNYFNLIKFSIDGITSFSRAPLEIWFYLGLFISFISFIYAAYYFIKTVVFGIDLPGYPSLLLFILFFSGLQITGIGILGKYIGRIFVESKQRPIFLVRKIYD